MRSFSNEQILQREGEFLQHIDALLDEAHFHPLPKEIMEHALEETNVGERVIMSVNTDEYDTLRFWVVGMDIAPVDLRPWYVKANERAKVLQRKNRVFLDPVYPRNYTSLIVSAAARARFRLFGKELSRVERYKRVVVAYRLKGDLRMHLKSFKDIPCENLEFLLPTGKMKICLSDKMRIGATWLAVSLAVYVTTVTNLIEMKVQSEVIASVALLALILRSWSAYNNMRIKCLCNVSQTLYFGAIATNHALLTLIADRASDEVFKTSLLVVSQLRRHRAAKGLKPAGMTSAELKEGIEEWLRTHFDVDLDVVVQPAIDLLVEKEFLYRVDSGDSVCYGVESLEKIAALCPNRPVPHPANSLDIQGDGADRLETDDAVHGGDGWWRERPFEWR